MRPLIYATALLGIAAGTLTPAAAQFSGAPECQDLVAQLLEAGGNDHPWGIDPINGTPNSGTWVREAYAAQVPMLGAMMTAKVSQLYPTLPAGTACQQIVAGKLKFVAIGR